MVRLREEAEERERLLLEARQEGLELTLRVRQGGISLTISTLALSTLANRVTVK